jgi:regulator of replication initiation timing
MNSNVDRPVEVNDKLFKKIELANKLVNLNEKFNNLLNLISEMNSNVIKHMEQLEIINYSKEINKLRTALQNAKIELEKMNSSEPIVPVSFTKFRSKSSSKPTPTIYDPNAQNCKEIFIFSILEQIEKHNYLFAIEYFQFAQKYWPVEFANIDNYHSLTPSAQLIENNNHDLEVILLLVCFQIQSKFHNFFALNQNEFKQTIDNLTDRNHQIKKLVNSIENKFNPSDSINKDNEDTKPLQTF